MESIQIILESTTLSDLFFVAAGSWGIEIVGLYLVPAFFSIIILFIASTGTVKLALEKPQKIQIALAGTLGVFTFIQIVRWGQAVLSPESFFLGVALLGGEMILFIIIWVLLIRISASLPKINLYATVSALFSISAFFILWQVFREPILSEILFLVAETLLFVGFCYITIVTDRLLTKISFS